MNETKTKYRGKQEEKSMQNEHDFAIRHREGKEKNKQERTERTFVAMSRHTNRIEIITRKLTQIAGSVLLFVNPTDYLVTL